MTLLPAIADGSSLADVRQTLNRTIQRVFDVTLYGAVADSDGATAGSGTDNTAAFVAAIAAASAKGGIVWVPAGHYRLATAVLTIAASGVHLDGAGHLFFDSNDILTFGRLIFDGGATSGEISDVSIRNLSVSNLDGVRVTGPGYGYDGSACLVTFRGCARFLAENVEAYHSPNYVFSMLRSREGSIRGCYGHDSTADGAHVQDGCSRVTIEGNTFATTGDDGIGLGYWGEVSKDTVIVGNRITDMGSSGIGLYGAMDGVLITGNTIDSTFTNGIKVQTASQKSGSYNTISGVVITGNSIRAAGMRTAAKYARSQDISMGIFVCTAAGSTNGTSDYGNVRDLSITNNTIRDVRSDFIVTDGTGGGSVQLMVVDGNICDGIAATGAGATAASGGGIQKAPNDTSYPGISLTGMVAHGIVTNNVVRGAIGAGVSNTAADATTSGNLTGVVPSTVILADTFTKANVTPSTAGPGNTATGNKPILMVQNSDGSFKGTGGISSNRMVFGSGGSYPGAVTDAGVAAADFTITADQTEPVYLVVGSTADTSVCTIFRPQAGLIYSRNNAAPVAAYETNFTAASAVGHTYRLRRTATQAFGYVDGVLVATVNLPNYPFSTYIGWGIDETSTGATGFTYLSASASI